ncbi:MAG: hypothetical protein AB7Q29_12975 [Vicinamibacterales bacterium]
MKRAILTSVLLMLAGAAGSAQDAQPKPQERSRTLTLTGCVEKGNTPSQFTINDPVNGKYEVSGNRIQRYVGQRVEAAGTRGSTRFRVKGGLWPNPNVAAQGGNMDPARAAVAAQPGGPYSGTGEIDLPTFKVKSVRTVSGGCE